MLFPTFQFAVFFSILFFLYWYVFRLENQRKVLLTAASYFFYACWEPRFCILLFVITCVNYICGYILDKEKEYRIRRIIIAFVTVLNILYLFFFRHLYDVISFFNMLFPDVLSGSSILAIKNSILVPIGISYYTFKCMSYTFDIYLCKMRGAKSFWDMALYVSFFPQLASGPIVQASSFFEELPYSLNRDNRKADKPIKLDRASVFLMSGIFKKMIIANFLSVLICDSVFENPVLYNTWELLLAVLSYTVLIYADFSGYSDMAIGLALLLGFETPANFNRPYVSKSVSEFWRRWHISFSSWLRDYLYFGLGGSRFGLSRTLFALFFTMIIAGFWHGAKFTFLLWGAMQGIVLAAERIFYERRRIKKFAAIEKNVLGAAENTDGRENAETFANKKVFSFTDFIKTAFVFLFVNISWLVFRSDTLGDTALFLSSLKNTALPFKLVSPFLIAVLLAGLFLQLPGIKMREAVFGFYIRLPLAVKTVCVAVFIILVYAVSMSAIPPFIYFGF